LVKVCKISALKYASIDSSKVSILPSFNRWNPIHLEEVEDGGLWEVQLLAPPGKHRFLVLLDTGYIYYSKLNGIRK
jgi:hypothetical protein